MDICFTELNEEWENNFQVISDKRLDSKKYKEFLQINNKKINNPIKKMDTGCG